MLKEKSTLKIPLYSLYCSIGDEIPLIQCIEPLLKNNTCRTLLRAPNVGTKHTKPQASFGDSSAVGTESCRQGCKVQLPLPQELHTTQEPQPLFRNHSTQLEPEAAGLLQGECPFWLYKANLFTLTSSEEWKIFHCNGSRAQQHHHHHHRGSCAAQVSFQGLSQAWGGPVLCLTPPDSLCRILQLYAPLTLAKPSLSQRMSFLSLWG